MHMPNTTGMYAHMHAYAGTDTGRYREVHVHAHAYVHMHACAYAHVRARRRTSIPAQESRADMRAAVRIYCAAPPIPMALPLGRPRAGTRYPCIDIYLERPISDLIRR